MIGIGDFVYYKDSTPLGMPHEVRAVAIVTDIIDLYDGKPTYVLDILVQNGGAKNVSLVPHGFRTTGHPIKLISEEEAIIARLSGVVKNENLA